MKDEVNNSVRLWPPAIWFEIHFVKSSFDQ